MASRARAQLHTQGGGKGAAPRIAAAAGGDDSLDRLRRRVADEKARHAETARVMRPPDFDARMAREPKANYERIALGHKVVRTQNTNYNLGERSRARLRPRPAVTHGRDATPHPHTHVGRH